MRVVFRILVALPAEQAVRECSFDDLRPLLARPEARVWVDLTSPIGEVETAIVRDVFKFHPIAIEDCFASRAHPKIDEYDGYLYLITHGLSAGATAESAEPVELDAFLGPNFLVTHHLDASRSVTAVMEQVTRTGIPLRQGATAVLHAILDRQVDGLESVLDNIESRVETLEDAVFARPKNALIASLVVDQAEHPRAAPVDRQAARGAAAPRTSGIRPDLGRRGAAVSRRARPPGPHQRSARGIPRHVDVDPGGVSVRRLEPDQRHHAVPDVVLHDHDAADRADRASTA